MEKNRKFESKVVSTACLAGKILLLNGSETDRVEKSICDIVNHYGYIPQSFVILTCIIVSLKNTDGEIVSLVERVQGRGTNLSKVNKVDHLIKNIDNYSLDEIEDLLKKIEVEKSYSFLVNIIGSCLGASFFTVLFNGEKNDFFVGFLGGAIIAGICNIQKKFKIGLVYTNIICGFITSLFVIMCFNFGIINDIKISIISILMIMVPGVPFINSIRDIFSGDLVTGLSRLSEVILVGCSLAIGSGIAVKLLKF
ncbi:threonine/serine exporter ThrE family protein [Fusobacterium sp. IOR10]|uniref:threonine/serine ThrE exporter family protein n=1 Tax=Fusobacterium sp. IOR10 TaxID=2665157 RepID=UPI0013D0BFC5|nr:threonine/serine exporter family protein [Fusobacterium sp. IOR10]